MSEQKRRRRVVDSSGDVFADLGIDLSFEDKSKLEIAREITKIITKAQLTQKQAAEIIGTDQSKISMLTRGRVSDFSLDRLILFLCLLGYDIDMHISRKNAKQKVGAVRAHSVAVG